MYCKGLGYQEKPDYDYLRSLLFKAMKDKDFVCDWDFDWNDKSNKGPTNYSSGSMGPISFHSEKVDRRNENNQNIEDIPIEFLDSFDDDKDLSSIIVCTFPSKPSLMPVVS